MMIEIHDVIVNFTKEIINEGVVVPTVYGTSGAINSEK